MQVNSLIGKKSYQKQGFLQDGTRVPVTAVIVSGNLITQIKTKEKEGYNALQIGIDNKKKPNKSEENHSKKAGLTNTPRFFREIRVDDVEGANLGSQLNVFEIFASGDMVDVTGVSKGKGFAGVVKRHGFHGGPKTHGQSDRHRAPGAIGQGTTPGRVYKGKRMAGRMGHDTVTVKNLEIIEITDDGVLLIKGLVPGALNSIVTIKKVGENKKFVPLYKEIKEEIEEKGAGHPSVSDDVQPLEDNSTSDSASLSESRLPESDENQEQGLESTLSSSENGQSPSAEKASPPANEPPAASEKNQTEKKEEVKENAG